MRWLRLDVDEAIVSYEDRSRLRKDKLQGCMQCSALRAVGQGVQGAEGLEHSGLGLYLNCLHTLDAFSQTTNLGVANTDRTYCTGYGELT